MAAHAGPPTDVPSVLARLNRPRRAVVTAGMPYANGPLHVGHLAGAQVPADVHARFLGMLIGRENVLYVCGNDDHGSTSELAAIKAGTPIREFIDTIHEAQSATMQRYGIGLDVFSGTSRPECFPIHSAQCQDFLRKVQDNGMLSKRTSRQWYDPEVERFLPDRFVYGRCPNPKCDNERAYSDECEVCGAQYEPTELIDPRSSISDATPEMRDTVHLWLDMWPVSETLRTWIQARQKSWRPAVYKAVIDNLFPSVRFDKAREEDYKALKDQLPKHKRRYAQGGDVVLRFDDKPAMERGREVLAGESIDTEYVDEWAKRPITRDIAWGVPADLGDPELEGKTLYVWPDSLLAPVAFSQVALEQRGEPAERYREFWCHPDTRIDQFLGQDNVFFYTLMQGAMWLGMQSDPQRMPEDGELQLTNIYGCFHLLVSGEKMSKSTGNFYTGDQLLEEKGYTAEQIRYYLALLGLPDKQSDFDFDKLDERNKFLAGPMNAAFERPISAAHSKFDGKVPEGELVGKVEADTVKMVQRYVRAMDKASYPSMLFELENYARKINSLFTQYKPHDDRRPEEERRHALYSSFYVLKNLMIMLYPFVPETMGRLRECLKLPEDVFRLDELGKPMAAGHELGPLQPFFPGVEDAE